MDSSPRSGVSGGAREDVTKRDKCCADRKGNCVGTSDHSALSLFLFK